MKKSMEEWKTWGKNRQIQLYFYEDKVLDLTSFAKHHPGGKKALKNYIFKDITQILFNIYPHKIQILSTLAKYIIGINISFLETEKNLQRSKSHKKQVKASKQKKKVCFRKTIYYTQDQIQNQSPGHSKEIDINFKQSKQETNSNQTIHYFSPVINSTSNHSYNSIKISSVDSIKANLFSDQLGQECNHVEDIQEIQECLTGIKIPSLPIKTMSSISL